MTYYSVEDGHGTETSTGMTEQQALAAAQRLANSRGESYYVRASDSDEATEVEPESDETA